LIRSCGRVRTNRERGYALVAAMVLAVLYFALIELLLLDSSRELAEARRFRSQIVALTLAENGAELAAVDLASPARTMHEGRLEDSQGKMEGRMAKTADGHFDIEAKGEATGVTPVRATVRVRGRLVGSVVRIQYTQHTP
jgi:predicted aspartyl protease